MQAGHFSTRDDLALLQGDWLQTAHEADGMADPLDEEHGGCGTITTFTGQRFVVRTAEGTPVLEGTFVLDASVTPKAITWTDATGSDAGRQLPASYVLEGDHFVFIAADEGCPRPTRFRTEAGLTMRAFTRIKRASFEFIAAL